jgi:hypothetical protein
MSQTQLGDTRNLLMPIPIGSASLKPTCVRSTSRRSFQASCFVRITFERSASGRFRTRYEAASQEALDTYFHKHAERLREDFRRRFPKASRRHARSGPRSSGGLRTEQPSAAQAGSRVLTGRAGPPGSRTGTSCVLSAPRGRRVRRPFRSYGRSCTALEPMPGFPQNRLTKAEATAPGHGT